MIWEEQEEMMEQLDKAMNKAMMDFGKEVNKEGWELTFHYTFEVSVRHYPDGENGKEEEDGLLVVRKKMEG